MSSKTDTEVIIGGKVYTLSGYESEEYLQRVASYINNKVNEYSKIDSFRRQSLDTQNVLLQLNVADDYFKAKRQIALLEEELQAKEKELYDLKHELISCQIKLENAEDRAKKLKQELKAANEIKILEGKPSEIKLSEIKPSEIRPSEIGPSEAASSETPSEEPQQSDGEQKAGEQADTGSNDFRSSDTKGNDQRHTASRNNTQRNHKSNRNNYQKNH